jgi:hypothetical protein
MVEGPICPKCEKPLNNNIGNFFDYFPNSHGQTTEISINYCLSCGYPITTESHEKKGKKK